MVDHQFHRLQRVDAIGIAAERDHRIAHRCEIDHAGHAGEILQQHTRGHEGDFLLHLGARIPVRERADVVGLDERVVLTPQQVLEEDLHRVRQPRDAGEARFLERRNAVDLDGLTADAKLSARAEAIQCRHNH
jgi:hypothetical protein